MHADIVVLPGDGIGPEVTAAAVEVLRAVAAPLSATISASTSS
jgi:3-isopropylmalate dehydrogenase